MRKLAVLLMLLCFLPVLALAEETAASPFARAWFEAQYALLVPEGVEAQKEEKTYAFPLEDGTRALALRLSVEGDLRFGRYAQYTRTALLSEETGEELALDRVFGDMDALQEYLNAYVEQNVLEELNTYLDANDLLPVPLDCVSMNAWGAAFHYPAERFMYFSGHAGAVQLQWYELEDYLAVPIPAADQLAAVRQGMLYDVRLTDGMEKLLARFGQVTEPDMLMDGCLIYDFEAPALRGVQAIEDGSGQVKALRLSRFDLGGVRPGVTREQAEALLGEGGKAAPVAEDEAEGDRLLPGERVRYAFDPVSEADEASPVRLCLCFDQAGRLYAAELWYGV